MPCQSQFLVESTRGMRFLFGRWLEQCWAGMDASREALRGVRHACMKIGLSCSASDLRGGLRLSARNPLCGLTLPLAQRRPTLQTALQSEESQRNTQWRQK